MPWCRRLEDVFRLCLQKTSSRRHDQDKYIHLIHASSEDVFKTSWLRPIYSFGPYDFKRSSRRLAKTSSRHPQDVLKTSSRCLQDVLKTSCQDVFKTSCKNVFKASSKRVQDIFKTSCKDVFKTFSRRIFRLNCLPRSHFWEIFGQCRKFASVMKISQVLVYHFTTSFSGCLQKRL